MKAILDVRPVVGEKEHRGETDARDRQKLPRHGGRGTGSENQDHPQRSHERNAKDAVPRHPNQAGQGRSQRRQGGREADVGSYAFSSSEPVKAGKPVAQKKKQPDPGRRGYSRPLKGQKTKEQSATEIEEKNDSRPEQPCLPVNVGCPGISTEFGSRIPSACALHDEDGKVDGTQ